MEKLGKKSSSTTKTAMACGKARRILILILRLMKEKNPEKSESIKNDNAKTFRLGSKKNRTNLAKALAANKKGRFFSKLQQLYLSFDMFGQQVEFTFKGNRTY